MTDPVAGQCREQNTRSGTAIAVAVVDATMVSGRLLLASLGGLPLICYAIAAARSATVIDRVVVVTGDAEVAATARHHHAEVIVAPEAASQPVEDIVATLRGADGEPEFTVVVAGNAPFVEAGDIDGTMAVLRGDNADAARAVVPCRHTIWRANGDGVTAVNGLSGWQGDGADMYLDAGVIQAARLASWTGSGSGGRTALYVVKERRCFRVGDDEDLWIATMLTARRSTARVAACLPRRPAALIMDFDGVFTDNRVFVDQSGRETVACSRGDGLALEQLRKLSLPMLVLSKEKNPVVAARCAKLALECLQGIDEKRPALEGWCRERSIPLSDVVYVGNDINDLPCFRAVGCAVAVADCHEDALGAAHCVLSHAGGRGALRELADLLIKKLGDLGESSASDDGDGTRVGPFTRFSGRDQIG